MSDKFSFRGGDPEGVPDGDYVLTVAGGHVTGLTAASAGGGGSLSVQDENGTAITGVTQLDFQGAGVTATAGTGEVVVTIPGGGGGGGGGILAHKAHNPATIAAYTTTSTSAVDVDATNLSVSFSAPSSGSVLVRLSALGALASSPGWLAWCLRSGSSVLAGSTTQVVSIVTSQNQFHSVPIVVTGLTAGSAQTFKWGWLIAGGSGSARLYAGGVAGQAVMEVHALP